jgi:hypothetical protein
VSQEIEIMRPSSALSSLPDELIQAAEAESEPRHVETELKPGTDRCQQVLMHMVDEGLPPESAARTLLVVVFSESQILSACSSLLQHVGQRPVALMFYVFYEISGLNMVFLLCIGQHSAVAVIS